MSNHYIQCPECGKPSDSIKCYSTIMMLCLFIYAKWKSKNHVACPHCMRKHLAIHMFTYQIITANIMFPFVFLWGLIAFLCTYTKGHSRKVRKILDEEVRRQEAQSLHHS